MTNARGAHDDSQRRPDRNIRGSMVLLLILLTSAGLAWVFVGPGFGSAQPERASTGGGGDLIQQFEVGDREDVDAFSGRLLGGGTFDSADLEGRVTVVNVWGSWCAPCREEAPVLAQVARESQDEGVRFLGINVRDNPDAALAFERTYDVPYPSIVPEDSPQALLAFRGTLAAAAVPTTVVVDDTGAVAARVVGTVSLPTLRGLLEDVAAERSG
jgi:thiol-disulfide isomerase/thioredoxin